jgi:hypothetical protein
MANSVLFVSNTQISDLNKVLVVLDLDLCQSMPMCCTLIFFFFVFDG